MAMTLDEYRTQQKISVSDLADRIGVSGEHKVRTVYRYLRHERIPGLGLLKAIEDATGGQVTIRDFPSSPVRIERPAREAVG